MKIIKNMLAAFFILLAYNCVQETQPKTITFKVETSALENPQNIGVRGSIKPLSWEKTMFMSDLNNDGVFEVTFELNTASNGLEFKFVKNDSMFELENQNNRGFTFEYKPETIIYEGVFENPEPITIQKR